MIIGTCASKLHLLLIALLSAAAVVRCGDGGGQGATAVPASPTVAACLDGPLPSPGPNEPSDAWLRARASLPANVAVLRPASIPAGFGAPALLEACVRALVGDDGPRYTIRYGDASGAAETLVFELGPGFAEWGNFPGPPTSTGPVTVRGAQGSLLVTKNASAQDPALTAMMVSWSENGTVYSVRANTHGAVTTDDLVRIAQALSPVP
jgi:hypothetical protein